MQPRTSHPDARPPDARPPDARPPDARHPNARPLATRRLALVVATVACGEGPAATSGPDPGDDSSATSSFSTSVGEQTTTADSSTTESACAGPFMYGPATSWTRYGYDAENSRFNSAERAITPASVACLESDWSAPDLPGVTSTPAVSGGVVYFGDWAGQLHAREFATGDPLWTTPLGLQVNDSPLVTGESVYVGDNEGNLHRVDRVSGLVQWTVELDAHPAASIFGSPVAVGSDIIVGVASTELTMLRDDYTFRGSIVALDAASGAIRWRRSVTQDDESSGAGVSVWSTPAVDASRNLLFIGTGNTYEPPAAPLSDSLLALDLTSGEVAWSRQFTAGDVYTIFMPEPQGVDADIGAAPNLFAIDERDVVGVGDKAGVYAVLDRDDGETVWATQLGPGSHLGGVMTTAAVGEGTIYVATNLWNGTIFDFGSDENSAVVYALDAATGTTLWQRPQSRPVFGAVTLAGGVVWHGTIDGVVHALDAVTGTELWTTSPGNGDPDAGIGGGFSVVDGRLLVGYGFWFFTEPPTATSGGLATYTLPG